MTCRVEERQRKRLATICDLCRMLGLSNSHTLGQVVSRARAVEATGTILSARGELVDLFDLPLDCCGAGSGTRHARAMALASECFKVWGFTELADVRSGKGGVASGYIVREQQGTLGPP